MLCKSNATTVVANGKSYIVPFDSDETHPEAWPCDHEHDTYEQARSCTTARWFELKPRTRR